MKTLTTVSALALTLAFAGTAAAQDADRRAPAGEPDVTYEFGDDHVDGDYRRPLGERLTVRSRAGRSSLVRPRAHYVPELLKSVERL